MGNPRLIKTFLPDGNLEGLRIIELSESSIKAFVVPRLKLASIKNREELKQPALYLLISADGTSCYVGECENFYHRIKNHDQSKDFWDIAIAFISNTNDWEKSDVKYLESRIVELAKETGSIEILNKTAPTRNQIHEFKLYSLGKMAADIRQVTAMLGYDLLNIKSNEQLWYCRAKKTDVSAQFRGDKFVILASSVIDKSYAPSWGREWPKSLAEREEILQKSGEDQGSTVKLKENVSFKSPNLAGGFATGRNINAWTTWKNGEGKTMDEVMRKGEK